MDGVCPERDLDAPPSLDPFCGAGGLCPTLVVNGLPCQGFTWAALRFSRGSMTFHVVGMQHFPSCAHYHDLNVRPLSGSSILPPNVASVGDS